MYSFYELSGTQAARTAAAAAGSLIITAVLMAPTFLGAIAPASPTANLTIGVLA